MKRPDYNKVFEIRKNRFIKIIHSPNLVAGSEAYYRERPIHWINDWGITYDPRNAGTEIPTLMPFILFKRQKELVQFFHECFLDKEHGAIEKCRDYGATWAACHFSLWLWKYHEGSSVGWGSRKEILVDKLGDPDSIFEKMRMILDNLPSFCKPKNFLARDHISYMKIVNPENGATITGEAGDNIGRGGRKTIYFKDESAYYEHAEKIEASLGDNTDIQIDISSVNNPDTIFQRKIETGEIWEPGKKIKTKITRVFVLDWRDHPLKTQDWYDKRRAKAEREGLLHVFLKEVDRDVNASVDGVLIPTDWIKAAIDAHKKLKIDVEGQSFAGFDVADEGVDNHSVAVRKGILLKYVPEWHTGDVGEATLKALFHCKRFGVTHFNYDCIGVGAGVKSETNRLKREKLLNENIKVVPWAASASPLYPKARIIRGDIQSPRNKDFYANLGAQAAWQLRIRFEKVWKAIYKGQKFDPDELISIDSNINELDHLIKQLSQVTYTTSTGSGKLTVQKKPSGTKSPNKFDAVKMCYWPILPKKVLI